MPGKKTIVFSPFTRVEGDLKLTIEIEDGRVTDAKASGSLFRNFEGLMLGRDPLDAIVILCRICGQCGAAHSAAAADALARAWGLQAPPNSMLCKAVMQSVEFILSHLAHFYFSFAPDLCLLPAAGSLSGRFESLKGASFRKALSFRRTLLGVMGLFAGKWPNTLAIHPGGVTRPLAASDLVRAEGIMQEFTRELEENLLGCSVDRWIENDSYDRMLEWTEDDGPRESDLGIFIRTAAKTGLEHTGVWSGALFSTGGFPMPDGSTYGRGGFYDGENLKNPDQQTVEEDLSHSWFRGKSVKEHPARTTATPDPQKVQGYSWTKAPRYNELPAEVGPLARLMANGDPLAAGLYEHFGSSVFTREVLRLHETVRLTMDIKKWLKQIRPEDPFYVASEPKDDTSGSALTEAPRGVLGHWVSVEDGSISSYQIVTPTSWNLSPRDSAGRAGPVEQALMNTTVDNVEKAVKPMLVVRSYDPCLYCSVH